MELLKKTNEVIQELEFIQLERCDKCLDFIISKYIKLKKIISSGEDLNKNIIKGSVRAYLDVFSDYENNVLSKMHYLEKKVDEILAKSI